MKTMRRLFGIALMLMVSMVVNAQDDPVESPEPQESAKDQVVVTIGEFVGGTIVEKSQEGQTVTITVTPAEGFTIEKNDIVVVLTVNPDPSATRGEVPSLAEPLTLEGEDPENLSDSREYSFTVPEGFGAWVKEANFRSLLTGTLKSGATWELTGEDEKTLVIGGEGAADLGEDEAPWSAWSEEITKVVIEKGINELCEGLLSGLTALNTVEIQNGEKIVGLGKEAIPANEGLTVDVAGNLYNEYQTTEGWMEFTITSTTGVKMEGVVFGENNSYAAYVFDEPLVVPSKLKVLVVTGVKDNTLIVEEITDIIPANVPVLVWSEDLKGDDFFTAKASGKGKEFKSLLNVAPKGGKKVEIGQVYLLYNDVFYFSQAGTIPEGGIYLELPEEEEQGEQPQKDPVVKTRMLLTIGDPADSTPTAIESSMVNGQWSMLRDQWFDLNGRRLNAAPTRSGLYIYNGKLVAKPSTSTPF